MDTISWVYFVGWGSLALTLIAIGYYIAKLEELGK